MEFHQIAVRMKEIVSEVGGIPVEDIFSKSRKIELVSLRHLYAYGLDRQGFRPAEIAECLGRERTTAYASVCRGESMFKDKTADKGLIRTYAQRFKYKLENFEKILGEVQ